MSFAPGKIVGGRYTIGATLGKTARGTTYSAITMPNREVALKVVSVYVPEKQRARLLEAIRKQNTTLDRLPDRIHLRVIEASIDEEGSLYVVTPRSPHPSLAQLVELCPLTPEEALRVMWRIARALDAVHEAGIAHLAIKPTNIFVGPAPEYAVELGDFCSDLVRRVLDDDDSGLWLAPEQIREPASAKAPADVYAAARIMFFALTGKTLPRGRRPVEYSLEIGRAIPPGLDGPLLTGLDPAPDGRFTSVTGLVEALGPASVPSIEALEPRPPPIDVPPPPAAVLAPLLAFEAEAARSVAPAPPSSSSPMHSRSPSKHSEPELFSLPKTSSRMMVTPVPSPTAPIDSTPALLEASSPAVDPGVTENKRPPIWAQVTKLHLAIGVSALGVIGLLLIVIVLVGSRRNTHKGLAAASAKPPPSATVVAIATTVATPPPPPPVPAPVETAEPAPVEPAPAPPAPAVELPPLGANEAQIDVTCEPKCDFVMLNGRASAYPAPLRVGPGIHAVNPVKFGHSGQWQKVIVKAGETKTIEFTMTPLPPGTPPPAAKKPCGKFLKRCD